MGAPLPVETTTDILNSWDVMYTCPECGMTLRRSDMMDVWRALVAIIGHAQGHALDREMFAEMFGEGG